MSNLNSLVRKCKKAIIDYHMVENESGIMVGLSGGKDSLTLLYLLQEFQKLSKYKFALAAGHIGLGYQDQPGILEAFCRRLGIPFYYQPTNISQVVFEIRQEKNPCSLCANMRRGALNNLAKNNGYDKVALGHHLDDVLETVLLKTFFEGKMDCFKPVSFLTVKEVTVIRPLIYIEEKEISKFAKQMAFPVVKSCCPANGLTKRQSMKEMIEQIESMSPGSKKRALSALQHLPGSLWQIEKEQKA